MKKFLVLAISLILAFSATTVVFAEKVQSPTQESDIKVISSVDPTAQTNIKLVLTPFADKNTLSSAAKEELEKSNAVFTDNDDLTKVCSGLEEIAKELKDKKVVASSVFNLSINDEAPNGAKVVLSIGDLASNYVALARYLNGTWEVVPATLDKANKTVTFDMSASASYAILTAKATKSPDTGDMTYVLVAIMGLALVMSASILKKQLSK